MDGLNPCAFGVLLSFVGVLLAVLAGVANRRALNRLAYWHIPRRGLVKAGVGVLTVVLGFVVLVTA